MRVLALDYGERRIGMAISDEARKMAWPLKVFVFRQKNNFSEFWEELIHVAGNYRCQIEIIVGNPLSMHRDQSFFQTKVLCFYNFLKNKEKFLVHLYDERFTTAIANHRLRDLKISANRRKKIIDSLAATIMLQEYLDLHSNSSC